ncbi:hypothetical protein L6164_034666 [Bauhinia variegata]|nr:hypothetical protein L6164_034666 [Bauhinia variegata]
MAPVDFSPPFQHAYPYPPQMYYPPLAPAGPRAYGLSYNTTYPSTSTYYYAAHPMHAYATYYRLPSSPPPSDPIKHYIDEDEGGCSIM